MKTLQYSLLLCTLSGMAITACASDRFTPVESPNPWQDDYTEFAVVDRQDKWGTYNVHDPAVTRVGDTYIGSCMTVPQAVEMIRTAPVEMPDDANDTSHQSNTKTTTITAQ